MNNRTRQRLPHRRVCESVGFEHSGQRFTLSVGRFWTGQVAEIFLSARKGGSAIESIARDAAIVTSLALQHGADPETIHHALTREQDGGPSTLLGAALDLLTESEP